MLANLLKLIGTVDDPGALLLGLVRLIGDSGLREKFRQAIEKAKSDPAIHADLQKLIADLVSDLIPPSTPPA